MSDVDLTHRTAFQHWVTHTIRYNDQDPVGHVNNAAMATFLEQGRTSFMYPLIARFASPGLDLVLARVLIDYLAELTFPGTVEIGSRLIRLGNRSFTMAHGVFKGATDDCVATGEAVLVFFDKSARCSTVPPPALRSEMARLMSQTTTSAPQR